MAERTLVSQDRKIMQTLKIKEIIDILDIFGISFQVYSKDRTYWVNRYNELLIETED